MILLVIVDTSTRRKKGLKDYNLFFKRIEDNCMTEDYTTQIYRSPCSLHHKVNCKRVENISSKDISRISCNFFLLRKRRNSNITVSISGQRRSISGPRWSPKLSCTIVASGSETWSINTIGIGSTSSSSSDICHKKNFVKVLDIKTI